jgi:hypothetical protein
VNLLKVGLETKLSQYRIPFQQWGQGTSKTLDHLVKEIEDGESVFIEEKGQLIRLISVLGIKVTCILGHDTFVLVEDRQVFKDGRTRQRNFIPDSVSEKLKGDEIPDAQAVRRALKEELRVTDIRDVSIGERMVEEKESQSYPGLITRLTIHKFKAEIWAIGFQAAGYQEIQADKTTYFVWKKLPVG